MIVISVSVRPELTICLPRAFPDFLCDVSPLRKQGVPVAYASRWHFVSHMICENALAIVRLELVDPYATLVERRTALNASGVEVFRGCLVEGALAVCGGERTSLGLRICKR